MQKGHYIYKFLFSSFSIRIHYLLITFQPLLDTSEVKVTNTRGSTKYSKLENDTDSPQRSFIKDTLTQQQYLTRQQEEHLEAIGDSLGSLKNMSRHIGIELDEQAG